MNEITEAFATALHLLTTFDPKLVTIVLLSLRVSLTAVAVATAIGLVVAVPAVLGYNILIRRNKAALEQVRRFAIEVEARILTKA